MNPRIRFNVGTGLDVTHTASIYNLNECHHFAFVGNGTGSRSVYMDNVLLKSDSGNATISSGVTNCYIGRFVNSTSFSVNGYINDFRWSDIARTGPFPTTDPLPPTATPSITPTVTPTATPTWMPTVTLTATPTSTSSNTPVFTATTTLTHTITKTFSASPTRTRTPTVTPTNTCIYSPTVTPRTRKTFVFPTASPTPTPRTRTTPNRCGGC